MKLDFIKIILDFIRLKLDFIFLKLIIHFFEGLSADLVIWFDEYEYLF